VKLNFAPLAVTLFLAAPIVAFAHSVEAPQTIEAQGHGEVLAKPDTAHIKMALVSYGSTAQDVVKANSATTKAIADALKAKLGNRIQIESTASTLQESWAERSAPLPTTWFVQGWVHVEIPSSAQVQLLEAVTAAGIAGA
jgi:uncharacterized protein YggE